MSQDRFKVSWVDGAGWMVHDASTGRHTGRVYGFMVEALAEARRLQRLADLAQEAPAPAQASPNEVLARLNRELRQALAAEQERHATTLRYWDESRRALSDLTYGLMRAVDHGSAADQCAAVYEVMTKHGIPLQVVAEGEELHGADCDGLCGEPGGCYEETAEDATALLAKAGLLDPDDDTYTLTDKGWEAVSAS